MKDINISLKHELIEKIVILIKSGMSLSKVCKECGLHYHSVYKALGDAGVTLPRGLPTENDLKAFWSYFYGTKDACKKFNLTPAKIGSMRYNLRRKYGQNEKKLACLASMYIDHYVRESSNGIS